MVELVVERLDSSLVESHYNASIYFIQYNDSKCVLNKRILQLFPPHNIYFTKVGVGNFYESLMLIIAPLI